MMHTRSTLAAVAAASLLALTTGCGGTSGSPLTSTSPAPKPTTTSSSAPAAPAADPSALRFGTSYRYDDGLTLTVTDPVTFTPSSWAYPSSKTAWKVQVTLTNGSSTAYDPSMFYATASVGGTEVDQVFDNAKKLSGSPSTKVRPGKTVSFWIGFTGKPTGDLAIDIRPSWEHDEVTYVR